MKIVPHISLLALFLFFFSLLKSQETLIKVTFFQPKKLIVDAGDNQVLITGQTITLGTDASISGGTPEYFYNWKDNSGNEYSTPTIAVNEAGSYYLTVTDENHCTAIDSVYVSPITSLEKNEASAGLSLFPNPSSGMFNFRVNSPGENFKIEVLSAEGRVVFKRIFEVSDNPFIGTIDLAGFDKGVYHVKLISTDGSLTKSIIIQ